MRWRASLLVVLVASGGGCNLFNTTDGESAAGRGPKSFDPYSGAASGALRLGLQMYNGCAVLANGEYVGKGAANIPYPTTCPRDPLQPPFPPVNPAPPMPLQAGAVYFLNQISLTEGAVGLHTDPTRMSDVTTWMKTQTRLAGLDWSNVGIIKDEFRPSENSIGPDIYDHVVQFGNAAWQAKRDDSFKLEVLNVDGNVVQTFSYDRSDFFAESAQAGHTQLAWFNTNVGRPEFPGDVEPHTPPPAGPSFPPTGAMGFRSLLRMDMILSTHPTKSFTLDAGLVGDGAIKLTWSQLPLQPFYFPVTFVRPQDQPATCLAADGTTAVRCDFGLVPEIKLLPPSNGSFYLPGDQVQIKLQMKDGAGNLLHPPDHLPSYNQAYRGDGNGILYLTGFGLLGMYEKDSVGALGMAGPKHLMRPSYEVNDPNSFYAAPLSVLGLEIAFSGSVPGAADVPIPTSQLLSIPASAKPGTYTVYWKAHRQFLGERFTKIGTADFQVGQGEETQFPGRVGNCQICHRGTVSLENVRHGLGVDFVEGCKTCHNRNDAQFSRIALQGVVHTVHMNSGKYPQAKNDCTFCHLTKESTTRPTYFVCASCHPQPHGTEFWDVQFQSDYDPENRGVFATCAESCHQQSTPTGHILPSQN